MSHPGISSTAGGVSRGTNGTFQPSADWHAFTFQRLFWLYGDAARARMATPQALADLKAWRELGRRSAA